MALNPEYTMQHKQGDTLRRPVRLTEDDDTPIDLTGCSVEFSIAKARRKTPAWTYAAAPEVVITDAADGKFLLTLSAEQTREWGKLEELEYEVTVTFADGFRRTYLEGPLEVRLEVAHEEVVP